jgi:hypothetical protein
MISPSFENMQEETTEEGEKSAKVLTSGLRSSEGHAQGKDSCEAYRLVLDLS